MRLRVAVQVLHPLVLIIVVAVFVAESAKFRHSGGKTGLTKFSKKYGIGHHVRRNASTGASATTGMWPSVFNLATKAVISANATCGDEGREEFCRMVDGGKGRCGICENFSPDPGKRHPIEFAIDGTNRWWQSPALFYGPQYEYITIIIDLKQIYQVAHVIIKAANSPRPGTWILERSLDGEHYEPWQFFARTDKECLERFGVPATKGKPHYFTDSEVICTSFYSKLTPMENGEIHVSLVHGRPGANETSPELLEFTKARYVRIKLMGLRGTIEPLPKWLSQDINRDKRLFYTIRDITILGQCVCNGHAENCRHKVASGHPECECGHHTCGPNCDKCCPMYNQRQWGPGSSRDARQCLPCNCNNHATSCHYDADVDKSGLSMDIDGNYQGGGVCDNCTEHTIGINCEKCAPGHFRPPGVLPNSAQPCQQCDCDPLGSSSCVNDGEQAGMCICFTGFSGERCDKCAAGYRNYPDCEPCPCEPKGTMPMDDCEGECVCKVNVEGKFCDRCKSGYFALRANNLEGCTACYCSGVTTLCESAVLQSKQIQTLDDWLITDLNVSIFAKPNLDEKGVFSVGNYELPEVEALYWLAPKPYLGNKLEAYSSTFTFKVHWVIMRGDTSGKPTIGPNIILIGQNGMKIAHGNDFYTVSNMTFNIKLDESGWYHIPDNIRDIVTRLKRTDYKGNPVSRQQFLSVLADIKYILLRVTFHTDQIEALLEQATFNIGIEDDTEIYSSVEKCSCPSGYSGFSCESCAFGFVRIFINTSNPLEQSFCGKCDCNGHSETCNSDTGECFCEHNTIGETCERCAVGYYGNPLKGTQRDCKKCACPLENEENNFSPSCQLDYLSEIDADEVGVERVEKYVCTQCPKSYTGDHCEICDDGFYGNPMEIGNSCKACDCNGGPCDRVTGQCLSCKGNTEGWKCDRCKSGHYGDASMANCKACQCDPIGSLSKECDNETGQCACREKFTGRTCDRCETGYGNVTALCTLCSCNLIGSKTDICDSHSGLCQCREGIEGFHCDTCQNLHYGFSETGCKPCGCNPDGSKFSTCDVSTGKCICKPNFIGRKCDRCKDGYYRSSDSCVRCECDTNGSQSQICDQESGICSCKQGVGGERCNTCLPNYYGTIINGCKECEPCYKEGHICHSDTGKCVCPQNTIGTKCEKCASRTWGYEPGIGCKACECSPSGSSNPQCDKLSGKCTCKLGYEGEKCNRCLAGYYGYKNCRMCNCNIAGTLQEDCTHGVCRCSHDGVCRCKANVEDKQCSKCRQGTFGLNFDNPQGCTDCFCFGRAKKCSVSGYTWDQIRTDEVVQIDKCHFGPSCWELPMKFLGDLTLSYGGYLRLSSNSALPVTFLAFITGNGVTIESTSNELDIKLLEENWRFKYEVIRTRIPQECRYVLTRECFMVVLQNVTEIRIVPGPTFHITDFNEVLLDKALDLPGPLQALTVEKCECPPEYSGFSCQNPQNGYYRFHPDQDTFINMVIGVSQKCQCNGRSDTCDKSTGDCLNCTQNTSGSHCELCAEGFYKDRSNNCLPCLCPSETQNFAKSCVLLKPNQFICDCKTGYTGAKCNKCLEEFYGNPDVKGGVCEQCSCNPYGSLSPICDKLTGLCDCKPGFSGRQCAQCISPRQVIQNGVCAPCDECTQILLNILDELTDNLTDTWDSIEGGIGPPWPILNETSNRYDILKNKFNYHLNKAQEFLRKTNMPDFIKTINKIDNYFKKKNQTLNRFVKSVDGLQAEANNATNQIQILSDKIKLIIDSLNKFGHSHVNVNDALNKAENILREIKDSNFKIPGVEKYNRIFNQCQQVIDRVNEIYKNLDPNLDPTPRIGELEKRMGDLNTLLDQIEITNKQARNKNKQNFNRYVKLNGTVNKINGWNTKITKDFEEIAKKINETKTNLDEVEEIRKIVQLKDFKVDELEQRSNPNPELYEKVTQVRNHVEQLNEQIKILKNTFNFTNDEWKKINASSAYDNLAKGVQEAEQLAKDARKLLKDAFKLIYPEKDDSLTIKTNLAFAFSDRLKQRIINLGNRNKEFKDITEELQRLKYSILRNGKNNNDLTPILREMLRQIREQSKNMEDLERVKEDAIGVSDKMANLERELNNLNFTMQYELVKPFKKYLNLTASEEINKLLDQVILTRMELQKLDVNFTRFDVMKPEMIEINPSYARIAEDLQKLKNDIQFTRQTVESINIALNISNCQRHYKVQNDILKTLSVTFKCRTCALFNFTNNFGDTVALEVKNNTVYFTWKNQGKNEERKIKNSLKTTTVHIERIGALVYFKTENGGTTKSILDRNLFKINEQNFVKVGDLNSDRNDEEACLHKIMLNDQNIGLWNFVESYGDCPGCQKDTNITGNVFFNGNAWRNVTGARKMNPQRFNIQFYITTFDENSLIFLAQDKTDRCSFIKLGLNDGRIELTVRHVGGKNITLTSDKKYNRGLEANVDVALSYEGNVQYYSLHIDDEKIKSSQPLGTASVFKIKKSETLIGGVPNIFNRSCVPGELTGFLGYLRPGNSEYSDHVLTASYNTRLQTGDLKLDKAWFTGGGYVTLDTGKAFEGAFQLSFLLRSEESNGFIMKVKNLLDLILENGKIVLQLANVRREINYTIDKEIHFIEIKIDDNEIRMNVDDYEENFDFEGELPKGPIQLNLGWDFKTNPKFSGGITNIVVNNNPVLFNKDTVKDFKRVEIGRDRPLIYPTVGPILENSSIKEMQNTEGCPLIANYETDPDAVKLGDKPESYIYIENNFWKKDYELEFQFRTFYPYGVLFITLGGQHYNLFEIREGRIQLRVKGRKTKIVNLPNRVNDGVWHTIQIKQTGMKKKRKLSLKLDGLVAKKPSRFPKNNVKGEIYVGGYPENFTQHMELWDKLHPFRGCMRSVKINGVLQVLVKNKKNIVYNNIGQCFPNIEEGAYFGGDAYVVYKSDFKVTKVLELSLQFRTAEQNGILLSVSNPGNSPALSVELQNGAVVMAIDMGNGAILNVTNSLNSDFILCDNRWHNITAWYSNSELTVNVDGIRRSWVQSDVNSIMDEIEAPLYIGGLPDNAPSGTLKIKENFKGCIRKLKIEDRLMDWTDMEELNNVLLNSCPVVTT